VDHREACDFDGLVGSRRAAVVNSGQLMEEDNNWEWISSWHCGRWHELRDSVKRRGGHDAIFGRWREACMVVVDGKHCGAASGVVVGARAER
jgi:hypothetical protein